MQESVAHSFFLYPGSFFHRITIEPETGFFMGNENMNRFFNLNQKNTYNSSHIFDMLDYYAVLKISAQYNRFIIGGAFQTDFPQKTSSDINLSTNPIPSFSLNISWFFKL